MEFQSYSMNDDLDDGSTVVVRAIQPDDKSAVRNAFARLSFESAYSRFFRAKHNLSARELDYFTEVDFANHVAIGVGLLQSDNELPIGIGRYIVSEADPKTAEIAFTVDDEYQGIGVGSLLLKHLCRIAVANGVEHFCATVLATNDKMMHVFQRSQLPMRQSRDAEVIEVTLALKTDSIIS